MRIFLSHPSRLKPLLREIRGQLPEFLQAWLDEDALCWGDDLGRTINSAIRTGSDFVLMFLDQGALDSAWVRRELEWSLEHESKIGRSFVLPIVVEAIASASLPVTLRNRVYLRLADYQEVAVSTLASQISEQLFKLVVRSFDSQNSPDQKLGTSQHHDKPTLAGKVAQLADSVIGDGFVPDIIIGIPRGGLVVAAGLSKDMERHRLIPVTSLWPHPQFDNHLNRVVFAREDYGISGTEKIRILLVDDICRSGRTLNDARAYLEGRIDPSSCVIKTGTIAFYKGVYTRAISPNYFVDRPPAPIRDFGGDIEPFVES
jgi:hypoxanthine phosphoribosyltransferase